MAILAKILRNTPLRETTRPGEKVHRWGDELAVVVLDSGEIGQFACAGSRAEVEDAVKDAL